MLRTLLAAAIAATVVFVWGFLYWAVLPLGESAVRGAPNGAALQQSLDQLLPESGSYVVPFSDTPESDTAYHKAHSQGPLALVHFRKAGAEPMAPGVMLRGWIHGFVSMLVMALVLVLSVSAQGFAARFVVAFGAGVAGSVFSRLGEPVWWYQPWSYASTQFLYELVAWLLGAIVLAAMIRPRVARPSPTQL